MFYRNIRLLILTIILIIFWGLSSFQMLPRMEDPQLTPRVATIKTFLAWCKRPKSRIFNHRKNRR